MRILLSCAVVVGLVSAAAAAPPDKRGQDKPAAIDAELLVGRWETLPVKGLRGVKGPAREFTADGKCYLASPGTKGPRLEGTYELDGNRLTLKWAGAPGVPGEVQKWRVKKLTRTQLILSAGRLTETWKRAK